MNEALTYIRYIFSKFVGFVFDDMAISNNVTIGWIAISVIVFSILISSILNLPRRMGSFEQFRDHGYSTLVYSPNGNVKRYRTYKRRIM